jgi:hypothetical protein
MNVYNDGSKCKAHNVYNRSVYSGINKCNFIPDCSFETLYSTETMPNGMRLELYLTDNKKHMRAVLYKTVRNFTGCAGILYNIKTGLIIYCEVNPSDRKCGMFKQLKALIYIRTNASLWYDNASELMREASNMQG